MIKNYSINCSQKEWPEVKKGATLSENKRRMRVGVLLAKTKKPGDVQKPRVFCALGGDWSLPPNAVGRDLNE